MTFSVRSPLREDQAQLWNWLHISLWDPPPAGLRPRAVLEHPAVRIYAEDWGRPTDVGLVAQVGGVDAGACQRKGYGRRLMQAALEAARGAGYERVSLTVHPQNPAVRLDESWGFEKRGVRDTYHLMVAALAI